MQGVGGFGVVKGQQGRGFPQALNWDRKAHSSKHLPDEETGQPCPYQGKQHISRIQGQLAETTA